MTALPVEMWTRRATDVEALPLDGVHALHVGEMWLRSHGVEVAHRHPTVLGRALVVPTGSGVFQVARLGQRLVLDKVTGRFAVCDEDDFRLLHDERAPVTRCGGVGA